MNLKKKLKRNETRGSFKETAEQVHSHRVDKPNQPEGFAVEGILREVTEEYLRIDKERGYPIYINRNTCVIESITVLEELK